MTYILGKFYQAASARDFVFHEEGVKMFLLAYLNLAEMYRYIFELKYLKSRDINTAQKKRARTQQALRTAQHQLAGYADSAAFGRAVKKVVIVLSARAVLQMEEIA